MRYVVTKPEFDNRSVTHGVILPDGYYRIIELTRSNGVNIESLANRGYDVDEYEGDLPPGLYGEADDVRYTDESVIEALGMNDGTPPKRAPADYEDPTRTLGLPGIVGRQKPTKVVPAKKAGDLSGLAQANTEGRLSVNRKPRRA
jgi:hypothetical protein